MEDFYKTGRLQISSTSSESPTFVGRIGQISEKEKFHAAKQILFGLAVLYIFTVCAYLFRPEEGKKLLDIITISFPPIATLILAAYFRDKTH